MKFCSNKDRSIEGIIRVNHAGEYGAKRIYDGQLQVLASQGSFETYKDVEEMRQQELKHLSFFQKAAEERGVIYTAFLPLWHYAGYALGNISARLGEDFAMTCTSSVENVINSHYLDQIKELEEIGETKLAEDIEVFRQEELEHKHHADVYNSEFKSSSLRRGLNQAFGAAIGIGCRAAIWISKRI